MLVFEFGKNVVYRTGYIDIFNLQGFDQKLQSFW